MKNVFTVLFFVYSICFGLISVYAGAVFFMKLIPWDTPRLHLIIAVVLSQKLLHIVVAGSWRISGVSPGADGQPRKVKIKVSAVRRAFEVVDSLNSC